MLKVVMCTSRTLSFVLHVDLSAITHLSFVLISLSTPCLFQRCLTVRASDGVESEHILFCIRPHFDHSEEPCRSKVADCNKAYLSFCFVGIFYSSHFRGSLESTQSFV
jgi:hypothetical protein